MATAKTIEQLNAANQINASDQMVFAQQSGKEAVRGSVQMLAGAVADINETGALSELVYATSQGKNLLAQNLTAKGVPTQAGETLIQMADKVNNLNVETITTDIRGVHQTNNASSQSTGYSYSRIFRNPGTGDCIILCGTMMYYVPYTNFTDWANLISKATHSLNISDEGEYSFNLKNGSFAVSEDFSKILVQLNASNLCRVYSISAQAGFLKLYEFTYDLKPTSNMDIALTNDGKHVFFANADKLGAMYSIPNNAEYASEASATNLRAVIIKGQTIYYVRYYSSAGRESYYLCNLNYNVSDVDGSITFSNSVIFEYKIAGGCSQASRYRWIHVPGNNTVPVLQINNGTTVTKIHEALRKISPCILRIGNKMQEVEGTLDLYIGAMSTSSYVGYQSASALNLNSCIVSVQNGVYEIKSLVAPGIYYIDTENNTLSFSDNYENYYVYDNAPSTSVSALDDGIIACTGVLLASQCGNNDIPAHVIAGNVYNMEYTTNKDSYTYAKKKVMNGQTAYYDPIVSLEDLNAGGYNTNTVITPAASAGGVK